MVIFLYGQDTYRSRQKLNEIVEHYQKIHQSGLNLISFEGGGLDFQDFKKAIDSTSMFKEKKLIVLKEIFSNQVFREEFLKESERLLRADNLILFWEKGEMMINDPLFKFLKKYAKSQEFRLLEGEELRFWVKRKFAEYQTQIEEQALNKLIDFVGNNLWQMENEIRKLVNYKNGKTIEIKDIELLVSAKIETDIFKTVDALAARDKKFALKLIHQHLKKGSHPLYLLSMINFQFRNLLIVKSYESSANSRRIPNEKLKMHPYLVKKTRQQVKKFTLEELKKIYQKIFQVDLAIKTGKIEPKTALDLLIAEI